MSTDNPLTAPILAILREQPTGLSEYELIRRLDAWWPPLPADATLALFQKHFLVMNALYRLQATLAADGLRLEISPLAIVLHVAGDGGSAQTVGERSDAALRDYYLDWSQLAATDRAAVDTLLTGFWQRFHAADAVTDAFAALELAPTADWQTVVAGYRRQAARSHPDRGGDPARFLLVRTAYEQLRLHFGR